MVDESLQERLGIRLSSDYSENYGVWMTMRRMRRNQEGKWVEYPPEEHENVLLPWRHNKEIDYPEKKVERLKEKFREAYPSCFPEELKGKGGTYWPMVKEKLKDEQILARILGFPLSLAARIGLAWKVKEELKGGKKILDLGFGYGDMSLILGEEIPECEIVAVEKDRAKVEMFRKVLRRYRLENGQEAEKRVTVAEGDIFKPQTYSKYGPFDLVLIKDMLGFLTDCTDLKGYPGENMMVQWRNGLVDISRRILTGVKGALKDGGKVVIFDRDIGERGNPSMNLYRLAEILEIERPLQPLLEIGEIGIVNTEVDVYEARVAEEARSSLSKEGRAALLVCRKLS